MIEPLPDGDVRVNARMPLDEVNDLLHAHLPEGDWDTVGGLFLSELGHVPTNGERVVVDGWELTAAARAGSPHRAHPDPPAAGVPATPSASRGQADAIGLRHVRRPTQRGEVDAAEPHPAHEGGHHLRQAADDPHPHPRRALPARRARSSSSTRPASTSRGPRWAPVSTPPPRAPSATSTSCASWSTPRSPSAAATSGSADLLPKDAICIINKVDAAKKDVVAAQLAAAARARALGLLPALGQDGRRHRGPDPAPHRPAPGGTAVLPRRHGHRRAGGLLGGRARARAAAAAHP